MITFSSGAAKLRQIALRLRHWPTELRRDAADRFKVKVTELLRQQHERQSGPGGAQWDAPKDGRGKKMDRTGNLRGGYTFTQVLTPYGISLRIDNLMSYSKFLQQGTPKMKRRLMAPAANETTPVEWAEAARKSYAEAAVDYWMRHRAQ